MSLPKRPKQHVSDDRAMDAVSSAIHKLGWVFRPLPLSDYGIDGEIEIRNSTEEMTGALLRVQVKGVSSESLMKKKTITVKTSTVRYWLASPVPVLIFIVTQLTTRNRINVIHVEDYLVAQHKTDFVKTTNQKNFTFYTKFATPFKEAVGYIEDLAIEHQSAILDIRRYSLYSPAAQVFGYYRLIYHYDCNVDLMLKHMRDTAPDDRLISDYGAAVLMKEQISDNPDIINEYRRIVEANLEDTGLLEVEEKPDYVKDLFN